MTQSPAELQLKLKHHEQLGWKVDNISPFHPSHLHLAAPVAPRLDRQATPSTSCSDVTEGLNEDAPCQVLAPPTPETATHLHLSTQISHKINVSPKVEGCPRWPPLGAFLFLCVSCVYSTCASMFATNPLEK